MENLINTYFKAFSNKDIRCLEALFSNEIVLKDWEIFAKGKKEVLLANKNIFDSVDTISADLKELYLVDVVAICLVEITINKVDILKVVDIIKFNDNKQIEEISAFKQ
jgi:hypothetical protein